jgi:hypothetical protein
MAYLDTVRDASSKDKHLEPGYWAIGLEATTGDHKNIPVDLELFSTKAPNYLGWYETIEASILRVVSYIPKTAEWLFDRGFDDIKVMALMNRLGRFWTIRQMQNRNVFAAGETWLMSALVERLSCPHTAWFSYVDKRTHKPKKGTAAFNFIHVHLPGLEGACTLIVVDIGYKEPMVLLSNHHYTKPGSVATIIRAYLRRWGVEEGFRFLKQKAKLEDFRVRQWVSIRRLALIAMLTYGYLALMVHHAPKMTQRMMSKVEVFIADVLFPYYRLWDGVAKALNGSG